METQNLDMRVIKRNGNLQDIAFDKILNRIKILGQEANIQINYTSLTMKVIDQLYDKIPTAKIDELAAEQCASMATIHTDYATLASRIVVSNHHKNTEQSFYNVMKSLYDFIDIQGNNYPLVSQELWNVVSSNKEQLEQFIDYERDYLIDYFGFKTLERSYLFKIGNKVIERPQHMWLRVAIGIHGFDLVSVKETYDLMSQKYFTHATPTLFNAGTPRPQLSSCYLIAMEDDSIEGIYNTLKDSALISKYSGGIGLHIHNIRAKGSHIKGTNGNTDGIVPMLRVFNNTARYVNQCFTPDTWVYSKQGPKQMKDIIEQEDELITIDGTFKKVNKVIINNVEKELLEIRVTNSLFPIKVTKEHQLYLIKDQQKMINFSLIKNRLNKKIIQPNYYSAESLNNNDLVGFPIPTYICDNDINDLDYYKFYGIMLGDGHICKNNKESGVTLGLEGKQELIDFVRNYLNKFNIKIWESESQGCISIKWSNYNNEVLQISRNILYNQESEKEIHNNLLHLPKEKTLKIIEGLLKSDGSNLKELYFYSSSLRLIMQLRYLLLRIGILTSGKGALLPYDPTINGGTVCSNAYTLRIPKHPNLSSILEFREKGQYFKYFEWNGMLWGRIKSISSINYSGSVYDFNMIDNHNYLTDMGLVHNSGRRNGSFAIYLETWHADIFDFLELRKNHGDEELKARDLFYALWISDLFMERVKMPNGKWSLFCPHECPGLADVYGDKFKTLYESYETQGKARKVVNARDLWFAILDAQMETGTPYILYKDSANRKSNQQNLGTIKSSNLCVAPETLVLTDKGHREISKMENENVNVWNGEEWSEVTIRKTGEKQHLISVILTDGNCLVCTPNHKFYVIEKNAIIMKEAQHLKPNDELLECDYPNVELSNKEYIFKILNMWFNNSKTKIEDDKLIFTIYSSTNYLYVKRLLQTIGLNISMLKYFEDEYLIYLNLNNALKLKNVGFMNDVLENFIETTQKNQCYKLYVKKIVNQGRIDDTYCFTEPKRHMGIFNGILTGQCSEIIEYSDDKETAVCNLASIALPSFVNKDTKMFDYDKLHSVTKVITNNLNKVIDINFYPTEKTKRSNMLHRPIGIGVQGLADTFILMDIPFHSMEAKELNKMIFETIYHAALERSNEIAIERKEILLHSYYVYGKTDNSISFIPEEHKNLYEEVCGAYSSFVGSPASQGILQFDMWNVVPSDRYDWLKLKQSIKQHGLRNSLLCAPMPTASTSQILGFNECFEPFTSNIYTRQTLAGEFIIVNKYLMRELIGMGLWNEDVKNNIIANKGSVQQLTILPEHIRNKYKIVWEIPMKHLIDMAADRGAYICQSQSLNLWMEDPVYNKLTSMHFYSWEKGLKTGIYYLRRKAKHQAQQFTIEPELKKKTEEEEKEEICEMCSA
jgi:ribonucleotide reductase alpha subunit